ncbi:MAG: polyprenyl synthetase family protein [Phycisphaerales bacterium]|nr:polyprenyl synthetase family protein [Phycisphaerales bacterium]
MPLPTTARASDESCITELQSCLGQNLDAAGYAPNLRAAVAYALLGGGKMVRPLLVLRAAEAVGGERMDALEAASSIEMVHAFSLIHDDLPALDNDSLRRGRPTLHVQFGEAMAILAGDALLALAIGTASASRREALAIVRELVNATNGMINGQVYDTLGGFDDQETPQQRVRRIHEAKTGALIRGACRMGAIAGGASQQEFDAIDGYGTAVGLMFQAVDDLLDETQSAEHIGKAVRKDREAGKLTYPGVFGLEATRREIDRLLAESLRALSPLGERQEPLAAFARTLAERTR